MKYNNQITMTGIAYYPKMATAKNGKGYLSFTLRYPLRQIGGIYQSANIQWLKWATGNDHSRASPYQFLGV